jgi:hypothetical protein
MVWEKSRGGSSFADRVQALCRTITDEACAVLACSGMTERTFIGVIRFMGNRSHEVLVRYVRGLFTMTYNPEWKVDELIQSLLFMIENTYVAEQFTGLRTCLIAM